MNLRPILLSAGLCLLVAVAGCSDEDNPNEAAGGEAEPAEAFPEISSVGALSAALEPALACNTDGNIAAIAPGDEENPTGSVSYEQGQCAEDEEIYLVVFLTQEDRVLAQQEGGDVECPLISADEVGSVDDAENPDGYFVVALDNWWVSHVIGMEATDIAELSGGEIRDCSEFLRD